MHRLRHASLSIRSPREIADGASFDLKVFPVLVLGTDVLDGLSKVKLDHAIGILPQLQPLLEFSPPSLAQPLQCCVIVVVLTSAVAIKQFSPNARNTAVSETTWHDTSPGISLRGPNTRRAVVDGDAKARDVTAEVDTKGCDLALTPSRISSSSRRIPRPHPDARVVCPERSEPPQPLKCCDRRLLEQAGVVTHGQVRMQGGAQVDDGPNDYLAGAMVCRQATSRHVGDCREKEGRLPRPTHAVIRDPFLARTRSRHEQGGSQTDNLALGQGLRLPPANGVRRRRREAEDARRWRGAAGARRTCLPGVKLLLQHRLHAHRKGVAGELRKKRVRVGRQGKVSQGCHGEDGGWDRVSGWLGREAW